MCGIAGAWTVGRPNHDAAGLAAVAARMAAAVVHRGPDDGGAWTDAEAGLAMGHRRLAIVDLSPAGHQPMVSASGRHVIVFNGEIYNHGELRQALAAAPTWRGHSDTETMLACVEAWGLEQTLVCSVGMFALALWDRQERTLALARDRLGEKPLYYGWQDGVFLFGSELKALRAHPGWQGQIDRGALSHFLRYAYVPTPDSIFTGIRKLVPGTILRLTSAAPVGTLPEPVPYWSARQVADRDRPPMVDARAAADQLEALLRKSIGRQMVADVPIGAFLSGGVDSSLVVALMQSQAAQPVRTFTIGFDDAHYDEAGCAKALAAHLGTDHTELYVSAGAAREVVPRLADMYDEPFADSSQIPTHLVAALARQHVTVSLSGDGGDELFGGYNRYSWGRAVWRHGSHLPRTLRRGLARAILAVRPEAWNDAVGAAARLLPPLRRLKAPGDKLHKLAGVLDAASAADLYRRLVSLNREPLAVVVGGSEPPLWADGEGTGFLGDDISERMMFHDLVGYLPDDILHKVDRAAMAVSLETRLPLLDHEVVEFAWQLPLAMKIHRGQGKWLLRQILYRYVPPALIERPKMGFGIPLDSWLRGPLRDWAEALLDESRLRAEGYLWPEPVRAKWHEHLSGRRNWQHWLWNILMFQAWLERWQAPPAVR